MPATEDAPGRAGSGPAFRYTPGLDGLRGVAILTVLAFHSHYGYLLAPGGHIGVDVFFVLSGFLITSILTIEVRKDGRIDLPRFYTRRLLRLLPALCVFLLVSTLLVAWLDPSARSVAGQSLVPCLFYYLNICLIRGTPDMLHMYHHLWSLSVEEQFYIVWPLMLSALLARGPRAAWWGTVGLFSIATLWQAYLSTVVPMVRVYFALDTRANALLVGSLVALLPFAWPTTSTSVDRAGWIGKAALLIILASTVMLAEPNLGAVHPLYLCGNLPAILATGWLCWSVVYEPASWAGRWLDRPWLITAGKLSYSLYIWHFPLFTELFQRGAAGRQSLHMAVELGLLGLVAWTSYRFVEQPCLKLKQRFAR